MTQPRDTQRLLQERVLELEKQRTDLIKAHLYEKDRADDAERQLEEAEGRYEELLASVGGVSPA